MTSRQYPPHESLFTQIPAVDVVLYHYFNTHTPNYGPYFQHWIQYVDGPNPPNRAKIGGVCKHTDKPTE
jgi:hypothetical protein